MSRINPSILFETFGQGLRWICLDFDKVMNQRVRAKIDKAVYGTYVKAMILRKKKRISFLAACKLLQADPDELLETFCKINIPNTLVLEFIRSVAKKGYKIAVASNNSRFCITYWLNKFKWADAIVTLAVPETMKFVWKPDEKYFRSLPRYLETTPNNIVFLDDNTKNIIAGQKSGLRSILYKQGQSLEYLDKQLD